MSRKSNDTPSATRIRENQRRSRTRRAELLNHLQKRIHEYEQQGVAATEAMQRAARKVAQDNARLRRLLALHGIADEEVESYLRAPEETNTMEARLAAFQGVVVTTPRDLPRQESNAALYHATLSGHSQSPGNSDENMRVDSPSGPKEQDIPGTEHSIAAEPCTVAFHDGPTSPTAATEPHDMHVPQVSDDSGVRSLVTEVSACPSSLECFCAPISATTVLPTSSGLEISCETAAAIIADMRGDGDHEAARASLGCSGRGDCNVKNSTVLQIMDERHS